jgi:hypothetical protein
MMIPDGDAARAEQEAMTWAALAAVLRWIRWTMTQTTGDFGVDTGWYGGDSYCDDSDIQREE